MDKHVVINKKDFINAFNGEHRPMIENLLNIMSKPLQPIIEKAFKAGSNHGYLIGMADGQEAYEDAEEMRNDHDFNKFIKNLKIE